MILLLLLAQKIDRINIAIGNSMAWLLLPMTLFSFAVVVLRYFFHVGWIWMQESIFYLHACIFMLSFGKTIMEEGHVRVDIFYRNWSPRRQSLINLLGSSFLLFPLSFVILYYSVSYVFHSWKYLEGSPESGGIPAVFLLKTLLLLMPFLLLLQSISWSIRSFLGVFGKSITLPSKK